MCTRYVNHILKDAKLIVANDGGDGIPHMSFHRSPGRQSGIINTCSDMSVEKYTQYATYHGSQKLLFLTELALVTHDPSLNTGIGTPK